jgi:transcriptional regulator with XRE-family HTH domain
MEAVMSKPSSGFGPRLKTLRTARGLTLAELAARSGLHLQGVAKIERGIREPNWLTVVALAKPLDVTPDSFLAEPEPPAPEPPPPPAKGKRRPKGGA